MKSLISKLSILLFIVPFLLLFKQRSLTKSQRLTPYDFAFIKTDNLGDIFIFLDCLHGYDIKNKKILMVVRPEFTSIVRALEPTIDVVSFDFLSGPVSFFKFYSLLTEIDYYPCSDLIVPTKSRYFFFSDLLALVFTKKRSSTLQHDGQNSNFSILRNAESQIYNNIIKSISKSERRNIHNLLSYFLTPLDHSYDLPHALKVPNKDKRLVLSPFTSQEPRNLNEIMILSILKITNAMGFKVTIIGAPDDQRFYKPTYQEFSSVSWDVGQTKLADLPELIGSSIGLISAETGTVQLAAMQRLPTFVLAGGGHYGRFVGGDADKDSNRTTHTSNDADCFGCNWQCTKNAKHKDTATFPCISETNFETQLKKFLERIKHDYPY